MVQFIMAARRDASGRADKPWLQSEAEYYAGGGFASLPEAVAYLCEPAMSAGIVQLGTWRASSPDRAYDLGAMLFFTDRRPTSLWTRPAGLPWDEAPTYLIRDNDALYGSAFVRRLRAMGIRDRPIVPGSPWQNGAVERLTGSIRRECLDHVLIFSKAHLRHILRKYRSDYNEIRTHCSLSKDAPISRPVERAGAIVSRSILGGLHHQYVRV